MALANSYVQIYGQLGDFFRALQQAQAPERFTQRYLKDLGFASTNQRALIPLLKALGFLSPDGTPTQRYHDYRDTSQGHRVMGEALRDAYGDLFTIKASPSESDRALIEGKFKSTHNCSDRLAKLMANTFFGLLEIADLDAPKPPPPPKKEEKSEKQKKPEQPVVPPSPDGGPKPTLHYNIQIHLPATKDIEVYNAIFKSLKEHLVE